MTTILCAIFFLSGASALIFEVLWFQLAGLTFGNSVWATSIVLSSFMGGLALGSGLVAFWGHKIKSPIRLYAFLEIVIATSGFALVLVLPQLTKLFVPLFRIFLNQTIILNFIRVVIAFILMLASATAMGATLPVLVKALYNEHPNFGRVLGILYGLNTLGAMAGVITGEIFIVKWFGIRGAGLVAAGFNVFAASTAIWLYKRDHKSNAVFAKTLEPSVPAYFSPKTTRLLLAGFLSGFAFLSLEVIWFRFIILFFFAHSWNFAVMLAVVLLGISLGGIFASKWFELRSDAQRFLMSSLFINGILIILLYSNVGLVLDLFENFSASVRICIVSVFLIFPVSFVSGIVFTMLGKSLHIETKSETRAVGLLTLANTIGGMAGALVAGLILIPYIGIEKSFFIMAITYGITAFLVFDRKQAAQSMRKISFSHIAGGTFLISLVIFPFGFMNHNYLGIACAPYTKGTGERRVAVKEGLTETIQYLQKDLFGLPYYHRLITNNYSMSGTFKSAKRYMKLFVYWPVALHPRPKNALLICLGCGSTAKALTDTKGLERIDIVDTSRDIVDMSKIVFPNPGENPVNDPRVKIHIEDGRFFLLTTKNKFDLITAEPPPPKANGIVNLYTQEYFQLIYDRLSNGGIVTYWLPAYQLKDSETKSILKGFCNVFKDCSLWSGGGFEWMMVGIKNPQKAVSKKMFVRQWNDPVVGPEMRALGLETPEQFGSLFIADGPRLQNWISDTLPLVDNYPRRLSYDDRGWKQYLPGYRAFMSADLSRKNFMASREISKIWPNSLRKKSEKYFAVRQTVNEMLVEASMKKTSPLINLNLCIHNPLLANYILWAFGSDQYAQRIISKAIKNRQKGPFNMAEIYRHLAAGAAQQRDYLLSEKYLHLAIDKSGSKHTPKNLYSNTIFRMYLLFMAGDKKGAMEVGKKYVNFKQTDRQKRGREIERYWNWLVNTFKSY